VTTERGTFFVRINEGKAEADVAWEARLVTALAAGGVATPTPLQCIATGLPYAPLGSMGGISKWVSVFPWRGGKHLLPAEVTIDDVSRLGSALGAFHRVGLALPPAWRRGSIYDHQHLVTRFARFAYSVDPALAHAVAIVGDELAFVTDASAIRKRATMGLIHGDLFRDNVLWEGDRLVAILDFEQASGGSLAYDIAVCINDWCWSEEGPRAELAAALFEGYERERPLTKGDRDALPIEVRAAAARFTITRITDVYLARVPNPDKDFRAFLARCEAWRGPALAQILASP
jgi:homoserine kinase type II